MSRWRDEEELEFSDTRREPEDIPVTFGGLSLSLYAVRQHITEHAWNGQDCTPDMDNEGVFFGQCEYAATAISEILTGTGKNNKPVNWDLRKRGTPAQVKVVAIGRSTGKGISRTPGLFSRERLLIQPGGHLKAGKFASTCLTLPIPDTRRMTTHDHPRIFNRDGQRGSLRAAPGEGPAAAPRDGCSLTSCDVCFCGLYPKVKSKK
jgi:hypothetical protein